MDVTTVEPGWVQSAQRSVIDLDRPQDWNAALAALPHSFFHRWTASRVAQQNTGHRARLLVVRDAEGVVRMAMPYAERWHGRALDLITPLGFSGWATLPGVTRRVADAVWQDWARACGAVCSYVAQHPRCGPPASDTPEVSDAPEPLYFIELGDGVAAAWARASKDRRREWRRWQERAPDCTEDKAEVAAFLQAHHPAFLAACGASAAAGMKPAALQTLAESEDVWMLGVRAADSPGLLAACVLGLSPQGAEGVVLMAQPGQRCHYIGLIGRLLAPLAARGATWLNLGGHGEAGDPLSRAKRQWRPAIEPFQRQRRVHDLPQYRKLCDAAGVSADELGYFPPYLRPPA